MTESGRPFAAGSVGGSRSETTPAATPVSAPPAKIQGEASKPAKPKQPKATSEKTPDATQPSVPKMRNRG